MVAPPLTEKPPPRSAAAAGAAKAEVIARAERPSRSDLRMCVPVKELSSLPPPPSRTRIGPAVRDGSHCTRVLRCTTKNRPSLHFRVNCVAALQRYMVRRSRKVRRHEGKKGIHLGPVAV